MSIGIETRDKHLFIIPEEVIVHAKTIADMLTADEAYNQESLVQPCIIKSSMITHRGMKEVLHWCTWKTCGLVESQKFVESYRPLSTNLHNLNRTLHDAEFLGC